MKRRLLSGSYEVSLDNRFRLAIPARVREPFVAGAVVGWWIDECLIVVPRHEWPAFIDRTFGAMSVLNDDQRVVNRFVSAGAFDQDLDKQGRVLLPPRLRDHAGVDGRATVVGAGDYLEIWNPERLEGSFAELRKGGGVSARAKRLADRVA